MDYGILVNFKQVQAKTGSALQKFVGKLGVFPAKALSEATHREVST